MSLLSVIILAAMLFVIALILTLLFLLSEKGEAVEIDLNDIEGWDSETSSADSELYASEV